MIWLRHVNQEDLNKKHTQTPTTPKKLKNSEPERCAATRTCRERKSRTFPTPKRCRRSSGYASVHCKLRLIVVFGTT
jgi:hypothetical protein